MQKNDITLKLCDEMKRLLDLNIKWLQKLVNDPGCLDNSAKSKQAKQLFDADTAKKRIEELSGELIKIDRKEMVLAVVGTMKAGKSTTINAIVGKEILPNRNRPMTSIPTLIRHVPGKTTPCLQLDNIKPIQTLLSKLKKKIATAEGKKKLADKVKAKKDQNENSEKNESLKINELLNILDDEKWLKKIMPMKRKSFRVWLLLTIWYVCPHCLTRISRLLTIKKLINFRLSKWNLVIWQG